RHTRFSRDWSSDVCSSDLERPHERRNRAARHISIERASRRSLGAEQVRNRELHGSRVSARDVTRNAREHAALANRERLQLGEYEIGRASWRERGWMWSEAR